MNKNELDLIIKDALNDSELKSTDIPAIDLYVDQIISLVAEKLNEGSERYRDRQLTKTMINNYSKDGLITPIKGKKYSAEQIIQILTVYTLKNTISIGEIKRMLFSAYNADEADKKKIISVYDRHIDIKHQNREYAAEIVNELLEKYSLDPTDKVSFATAICSLISLSAQLRNIAVAMIDAEFPELPEEDDKAKEKETKKAEKAKEKEKEKAKDKEKKKKKNEGEEG